jgi:ADP-ribose pyrophosphatase YjhB (NUDIX family)
MPSVLGNKMTNQIPKNAKKVFSGVIFEVYQWKQKMFDGKFKIFERIVRQNTVIILASYKNKVVVLKQKQPGTNWFFCTPSGRMDIPGEAPTEAALRELREETGMIPGKLKLWKKSQREGKVVSTIYIFIAQNCKIVGPQKLDNGEKIQIKLFDFEKFLKLSDNPTHHIAETLNDLFLARLNPKFKEKFKKAIFG